MRQYVAIFPNVYYLLPYSGGIEPLSVFQWVEYVLEQKPFVITYVPVKNQTLGCHPLLLLMPNEQWLENNAALEEVDNLSLSCLATTTHPRFQRVVVRSTI